MQGYRPIIAATARTARKSKLLEIIETTIKEGEDEGPDSIDFRNVLPHMGYKFRLDVTEDKINRATARYLSTVGVGMPHAAVKTRTRRDSPIASQRAKTAGVGERILSGGRGSGWEAGRHRQFTA